MQLAPGDRLGPYQITAAIGEGGMGQVYKAKDTRLDRTVAIKILPAVLGVDRQFRERFDREARAISQLDHPHICALHDVGEHNGTAYLVMPFLEGETLEQRLRRGALPAAEAVAIGIQIADALSRAHSAGIIHRDLKPANVMLTKAGARLLDFGLAKNGGSPAVVQPGQTQTARLTSQGTIIGTFQYMAPEQIEGAEGDVRTDVWGFGCVLYEMLSGSRPFDAKSTAGVLANILNASPQPVRDRQPGVNRALDHIVRRSLEKDPEARWQSMADVAHELRWAASPDESATPAARAVWQQPAVYAALLLFAAAGFLLARLTVPAAAPGSAPLLKLALVAPAGLTFTPFGSNGNPNFALSPDGTRIAYVAAVSGRAPSVWVQRLDARTAREVPGSSEASAPFWSSDGQWIGFFSERKLKRSGLESEQSQVIASTEPGGGTWHGDVILFATGLGPVMRIAASGGRPSPVSKVEAGEVGHRWPQFLADGRHFIYSGARSTRIAIAALDSNASAILRESGSTAVAFGSSDILFVPPQSTTLQAQTLDLSSLRLTGEPRDILENVRFVAGSGFPPASVSRTGLLAYWDGTSVATGLAWYDRAGASIPRLTAPADAPFFTIAPDGERLAYMLRPADGGGLWLMEKSGVASRLTLTIPGGARPIWSRDGTSLSFTTGAPDGLKLMRRDLGAGGIDRTVGEVAIPDRGNAVPGNFYANDWSRDGNTALVSVTQPETGRDIIVFSAGTGRTAPFVTSAGTQVQPRFSPDDRWVAYTSSETGRWEVFVESFGASRRRHQVSIAGGSQPIWRRDGSELFFAAPDGKLMVVAVTPGERWVPATPRALFQTRMRPLFAPYPYTYDVSPDGRRFLVSEVNPHTGPVISIVTDWRSKP